MEKSASPLAKILSRFAAADGLSPSPVPGVHCVRYSRTDRPTKRPWRACFAIVAQGCKEVTLGRDIYRCREMYYTATPIHLPVISRVAEASGDRPFLALLIDLKPALLSEINAQLAEPVAHEVGPTARSLFRGLADKKMLAASVRLAKLFASPTEAKVLGPLLVKEILFYLLRGPEGAAIREFARAGSKMHKISQAIHVLRTDLHEDIDIATLAKHANMSRSAFFKHFHDVTAMSPVQYQKRLRLLEARRMMLEEDASAEGAAFTVGYKSASHFSREYSRMFGNAPLRDVNQSKTRQDR